MARALKVWGTTQVVTSRDWERMVAHGHAAPDHNRQARVIVSASTVTRARALLAAAGIHATAYRFREWWGETANEQELAAAAEREGIWMVPDRIPRPKASDYVLIAPLPAQAG